MIKDFLQSVVTTDEGHFCLSFRSNDQWWNEWFDWPNDLVPIEERALTAAQHENTNVYFTAHLFAEPCAEKQHVLPSRTIQADLDNAPLEMLPVTPSILLRTSRERHQALWLLSDDINTDELEELSKRITYAIPQCDRSGWPLGHRMRMPYTYNYKYVEGRQEVTILTESHRQYESFDLQILPPVQTDVLSHFDAAFLTTQEPQPLGPNQLLETIRYKLPTSVYLRYTVLTPDRSAYMWALMCSAFEAGLNRHQVFYLAQHTINNKFRQLLINADRELAKDVLRAEEQVRSGTINVRELVTLARKRTNVLINERRTEMLNAIRSDMARHGEFIHTSDEERWYIHRDNGRPLEVAMRSGPLRSMLDIAYGLNPTEQESLYVASGLETYVDTLPTLYEKHTLSYYQQTSNTLYLHDGRRNVLRISAGAITNLTNGDDNIIFPWFYNTEQFLPRYHDTATLNWPDILVGNTVDTVMDMEPAQAKAVLAVWFLFILFREAAHSKPILTLLGQPGAGKSNFLKKVYALLYGGNKHIGSVSRQDDYNTAVSNDPLVALDNVDSYYPWLYDSLALAADKDEILKRKLFTNNESFIIRRQALVAITAHNPRFAREDIADRMLLLNFRRRETFIDDAVLIGNILQQRNQLWAAIIKDIQQILRTPMPSYREAPQFRIQDFATIGLWIARGLNIAADFVAALEIIKLQQKLFNLEEDVMLVETLRRLIAKGPTEWLTVGALWMQLGMLTSDSQAFTKRYSNAKALANKLWVLQESLKTIMQIEWQHDKSKATRTWRFAPLATQD